MRLCDFSDTSHGVWHLGFAMKELSETRVWLKIIVESDYIEHRKLDALIGESVELTRILSASVITARNRQES